MENEEVYYLISESTIDEINSKIVVLNKAVQFMRNEEFYNFADSLEVYGTEVGVLVNSASKCDVIPRNKDKDR